MKNTTAPTSPVLKWVGGKSQILNEVLGVFPDSFNTYHEPFLGGAAVFFSLDAERAVLSDSNKWLIGFYEALRSTPQALIEELDMIAQQFNSKPIGDRATIFYQLRDEFNSIKDVTLRKSALFLALNKTCFNGLYRENAKGIFNVPYNQAKSHVRFLNPENFLNASNKLQNADLSTRSFETVLDLAVTGDLAYFDPPYVPLTETSSFTSYSAGGFGESSQKTLIRVAKELVAKGVYVVLSNSYSEWIVENYTAAGFKVLEISAKRSVAARATSRAAVSEALIVPR